MFLVAIVNGYLEAFPRCHWYRSVEYRQSQGSSAFDLGEDLFRGGLQVHQVRTVFDLKQEAIRNYKNTEGSLAVRQSNGLRVTCCCGGYRIPLPLTQHFHS